MRPPRTLPRPPALAALLAVLAFALAGCGGGTAPEDAGAAGGGRAGALSVSSSAEARLFVPDLGHGGIVALSSAEPAGGATLPAPSAHLDATPGFDVQLDPARDELYAIAGRYVVVYADAGALAAGALPARSFPLPDTLTAPHALFLDVARDTLYVGGGTAHGGGEIVAYPFAHTLRGAPATPARALMIDHGVSFFTIDPSRGRLYVINADPGVHVFGDVDGASGALAPVATLPVTGTGLAIDPLRDRLYVADAFAGLLVVDHAGGPAPVVAATLPLDDARYVSVDAADDRAWVTTAGTLYTLDHASALDAASTLPAPAVAAGDGASFGAPAWR